MRPEKAPVRKYEGNPAAERGIFLCRDYAVDPMRPMALYGCPHRRMHESTEPVWPDGMYPAHKQPAVTAVSSALRSDRSGAALRKRAL